MLFRLKIGFETSSFQHFQTLWIECFHGVTRFNFNVWKITLHYLKREGNRGNNYRNALKTCYLSHFVWIDL